MATRLHGIEAPAAAAKTRLGPVLTTTVSVEGAPAQAMIDTGSPVTIVDLDFLVQALAKKHDNQQTPSEWMKAVEQRFEPPGVPLKSYGGAEPCWST